VSPRDAGKPDSHGNQPKPKSTPGLHRSAALSREQFSESFLTNSRASLSLPPAPVAAGPDASSLFKALKRRWLLALTLGIVVATTAGVAAWYLQIPKNVVLAQIQFASRTPGFLHDSAFGPSDFLTYLRTESARIKHPLVLNEALKREDVKRLPLINQQPEPLMWLGDELKVEFQEGSEIVKVSMAGEEAEELKVLVNAIIQAFLKEINTVEHKQQTDLAEKLEEIYNKSRDKLRAKRDNFSKRAEEAGTGEAQVLSEKQKGLVPAFGELVKQHILVQFDLMKAQGKLLIHKARGKNLDKLPIPKGEVDLAVESDPLIKEYTIGVPKLQEEVEKYLARGAAADDISVVYLQKLVQSKQKKREEREAEIRGKVVERIHQKNQADFDLFQTQFEEEVASLTEQEKKLREVIEQFNKENKQLGTNSTELEILRAEIGNDEAMVKKLGEQLETTKVELQRAPRVTLYQEAALQKKDIRRQVMATVAAPTVSLIGVCFFVGWWEFRARRIHSADEVVQGLGLRLVGAVPALPVPADGQFLGAAKDPNLLNHRLLESIDAIRTVLLRDANVAATRIVMVTSALNGEGKTTLAGHLASSLARAGRRTLLMDCDLRTPAAHQLLEQTLQPGLSEVLLEEIALPDAVRPATALEGLWLLPAGQWDREVLQALAQDGPQRIFDQLREEFDFVIVDSHPVLEAADSLLVAQHVDAVILSLLRDKSQVPPVYSAAQRLTSLGVRVLGAVVNGVSPEEIYRNGDPYPLRLAG